MFETSGRTLKLTRSQKHNILENMAETMHRFKPYHNDREVGKAAEAPVTLHPCLRELGSDSGWYGWKVSLQFKMGIYLPFLGISKNIKVGTPLFLWYLTIIIE